MSALAPFELTAASLYSREGLLRLDAYFLRWLGARDSGLAEQLVSARAAARWPPPVSLKRIKTLGEPPAGIGERGGARG